jgi:hypothetical protein
MDFETIPLKDLHFPPVIDWWPLAVGWQVLIIIIFIFCCYLLHKMYLRWKENKARRIAIVELKALKIKFEDNEDPAFLIKQLSELLRRTMLAYVDRKEVAGLTGTEWLEFLDRGLEEKYFTLGIGQLMESLPYKSLDNHDKDVDIENLIDIVLKRLKTPIQGGIS